MRKPNIFNYATSELSQDAFFCWLIQWADLENEKYDKDLYSTAKSFLSILMNNEPSIQIDKVLIRRQWNDIDIAVEINDNVFIAIEDKTNTTEHSNQLERYKEIASNLYKDKKLFFIYLKTGNESLAKSENVKNKEYTIIDRSIILPILNGCKSDNNILKEFTEHLNSIEQQTNSFEKYENIISNSYTAQGFYQKL